MPITYRAFFCQGCAIESEGVEENWDHFLDCHGYNDNWALVHSNLETKFSNILGPLLSASNNPGQSLEHLVTSLIGTTHQSDQFHDWKRYATRAFLPNTVIKLLKKSMSISTEKASALSAKLLLSFIREFRHLIWTRRCEKTVEWEKLHNISTRDKKVTSKEDIQERKRTHNKRTITPASYPVIYDDILPEPHLLN